MSHHATFKIDNDASTPYVLTIIDLCEPERRSVTNDAEYVVAELDQMGLLWPGRKLNYRDSQGSLDQLLVENGRFVGFAPAALPAESLEPFDYQRALDSQTACNPLALINELARVGKKIKAETVCDEEFASHPILTMYLTQLCHLAGGSFECEDYASDHEECERQVARDESDGQGVDKPGDQSGDVPGEAPGGEPDAETET